MCVFLYIVIIIIINVSQVDQSNNYTVSVNIACFLVVCSLLLGRGRLWYPGPTLSPDLASGSNHEL